VTTEAQREQEERQTVLNDARVRAQQQGSTFAQFAESEAGTPLGRHRRCERLRPTTLYAVLLLTIAQCQDSGAPSMTCMSGPQQPKHDDHETRRKQ
jgi:hypothetical protein